MQLESVSRQAESLPPTRGSKKVGWLRKGVRSLFVAVTTGLALSGTSTYVEPVHAEEAEHKESEFALRAHVKERCGSLSEELEQFARKRTEALEARDAAMKIIDDDIRWYQKTFLEPEQYKKLRKTYYLMKMNLEMESRRDDLAGVVYGKAAEENLKDAQEIEKTMAEKQYGEYIELLRTWDGTANDWKEYFEILDAEEKKRIDALRMLQKVLEVLDKQEEEEIASEIL